MEKFIHCDICSRKKMDIKKGLICGLTNEKPNFHYKCPSALFDNSWELELIKRTYDYKIRERDLVKFKNPFIFNLIISSILMIVGILLFNGVDFGLAIVYFIGTGAFLFTFGLLLLSRILYLKSKINTLFEIASNKLKDFEELAKIYAINYKLELELEPEIHGETRFNHHLKLEKNQFFNS